jgi:FeS assembly SUF system protein
LIKKSDVINALKECYDPEIPVNIVDLGLIYDVKINKNDVHIKMTLTTPGCPMHAFIIEDVKQKVKKIKGVKKVNVEIVWNPPWSPDRMSPRARRILKIRI